MNATVKTFHEDGLDLLMVVIVPNEENQEM